MRKIFTLVPSVPVLQRIVLSTLLLCSVTWLFAATFTSRASGDWNVASTWTVSGGTDNDGIPDADDVVNIIGGHIVNLPTGYSGAAQSLQIGSPPGGSSSLARLNLLSNAQLTVGGTVTVGGGGNRGGQLDMATGTTLIANNLVGSGNNVIFNTSTGTIELRGSGTLPTQLSTVRSLIINGGTTTLSRNINITNDLTVLTGTLDLATFTANGGGSGIFNVADGATLRVGGDNNFPTGYTVPPTLHENSTVEYYGGAQTVSPQSYGNLILSGTGAKDISGVNNIRGNLTLNGTATAVTGTTLLIGRNLNINAGTSFTLATGADFTVTGVTTVNGTLTINPGGTKAFSGDVIVNTGGTWTEVNNPALQFGGNITNNGTFTAGLGAHLFSGINTPPYSFNGNISIPNVTINTYYINNGTLSVSELLIGLAGTLEQAPNANLNIGGESDNLQNLIATATGNTVQYNGTENQELGTTTAFYNLIINNPKGVTLSRPISVAGTLTLTNGIVDATDNNYLLTLTDGATVVRTNPDNITTAFVDGPVRKIGDDAFVFPVGVADAGYHPIAISAPASVTDEFTAEYFRPNPFAGAPITAEGLNAVDPCEYWTLNRNEGSTSAVNVTLFYNTQSWCGGATYTDVIARYNGTSWFDFRASNVSGEPGTSGSVTWNSVTDFTPANSVFTLGTSSVQAPLPVTFVSINARTVANGTEVSWKVADQVDVLRYEVERSSNGINFSSIGSVPAADVSAYSFIDRTPAAGTVYYRVKNVDNDGRYKYSTVVALRNGAASLVVKAFPIPARNQVTLQHGAANQSTLIRITAQDGRMLQTIRPAAGSIQTEIQLHQYTPGLYILTFDNGNGNIETIKLVKQ